MRRRKMRKRRMRTRRTRRRMRRVVIMKHQVGTAGRW
jgi:hypothetical protein